MPDSELQVARTGFRQNQALLRQRLRHSNGSTSAVACLLRTFLFSGIEIGQNRSPILKNIPILSIQPTKSEVFRKSLAGILDT